MTVQIADREFKIKLVHGRIYLNGKQLYTMFDQESGEFQVSDEIPIGEYPAIIASAINEAWARAYRSRSVPVLGGVG